MQKVLLFLKILHLCKDFFFLDLGVKYDWDIFLTGFVRLTLLQPTHGAKNNP